MFARKGARAPALHEIAAEAGLSNGTFYNYFRTREELVEAASTRLTRRGEHASAVAVLVLRDLGVAPAEADAIAQRPLPPPTTAPSRAPEPTRQSTSSPGTARKRASSRTS